MITGKVALSFAVESLYPNGGHLDFAKDSPSTYQDYVSSLAAGQSAASQVALENAFVNYITTLYANGDATKRLQYQYATTKGQGKFTQTASGSNFQILFHNTDATGRTFDSVQGNESLEGKLLTFVDEETGDVTQGLILSPAGGVFNDRVLTINNQLPARNGYFFFSPSVADAKAEWGYIKGTLSDQTDLQLELALRSYNTHTHGNISNAGAIGTTANVPVITGASGVLQAGAFGTGTNTFCQGNDSRLSDARTPTSHTHGNITNTGAIGATANLPIITGTSGVLQAGAFGTAANTFCEGNDSRLSDVRTPTSHASSHQSGGTDSIKLDDLAAPDDNADLNATTSAHGLLPKLGGGTTNFLRADGTWAAPPGGVSGIGASATDILSVSGGDIVADDPNADRLVFWDDSASKLAYLEAGTGLSISGTTITATGTSTDVKLYTANDTWSNPSPSTAKRILVRAVGGGGGGGSGRRGSAGTVRCGGGGGAGACVVEAWFLSTDLGSTVSVTVGAGGTGGAAQSTNSTNGNPGGAGGDSIFDNVTASGGNGGGAGTTSSGTAGGGTSNGSLIGPTSSNGSSGGAASTTGGGGGGGTGTAGSLPAGGSAGGGITSGDSASNGAVGGTVGNSVLGQVTGGAGGTSGGNGSNGAAGRGVGSGGGGGGARRTGGASAGNGGNGGGYGAGGGGGGAGENDATTSGKGGDGAPGYVLVITFL